MSDAPFTSRSVIPSKLCALPLLGAQAELITTVNAQHNQEVVSLQTNLPK